jgi:hypothetical protein
MRWTNKRPDVKDQIFKESMMQTQTAMTKVFGDVIHRYGRAQAIEDGLLVDLSGDEAIREDVADVCRRYYKHPIACTPTVFDLLDAAVKNERYCNDYAGLVHDVLWMSKCASRKIDDSAVVFPVIIAGAGRRRHYDFKLIVGPGEQGEPVITIMMPDEG